MKKIIFSIHGEAVTEQARTFVLEENWEYAVRFLMDSLVGFTYDHAFSILSGNYKLIGINEVDLVEEDEDAKKEYLAKVNYLYSNVVLDKVHFKPYGYISFFSEQDVNLRTFKLNKYVNLDSTVAPCSYSSNDPKMIRWSLARCTYYMNDMRNDKAVICNYNGKEVCVLFEEVKNYPLFLSPISGPNAYQKAIKNLELNDLSEKFAKFNLESSVKNPEKKVVENIIEEILEPTELEKSFINLLKNGFSNAHDLNAICGWISPDGYIIPCEYYQHITLASCISDKLGLKTTDLESLGYIKLQNKDLFLYPHKNITQKQYDTIFDYCELHQMQMPEDLEIK